MIHSALYIVVTFRDSDFLRDHQNMKERTKHEGTKMDSTDDSVSEHS